MIFMLKQDKCIINIALIEYRVMFKVFLELLVTAKSAIIRYRPDTSMISGRIPDN